MDPEQDFNNVVQKRDRVLMDKAEIKLQIGRELALRWVKSHFEIKSNLLLTQPQPKIDEWFRLYGTPFSEVIRADIEEHVRKGSDNYLLIQYANASEAGDIKSLISIVKRIESSIYQPLDTMLF